MQISLQLVLEAELFLQCFHPLLLGLFPVMLGKLFLSLSVICL